MKDILKGGILGFLVLITILKIFSLSSVIDYRVLAQHTPTPVPYKDSCGAGSSCNTKGSAACIAAGGDPVSCTTQNGTSGNCCSGSAATATMTPKPTAVPTTSGGGSQPTSVPTVAATATIPFGSPDPNNCVCGYTCTSNCLADHQCHDVTTLIKCGDTVNVYTSACCIVPTGVTGCTATSCTNTCNLGGCPGGCGSEDNCGGVSCSSCGGGAIVNTPAPTSASCTPNCNCATNLCNTQTCSNGCGAYCYGKLFSTASSAPTLVSPVGGASVTPGNIPLTWQAPADWGQCPGATSTYEICVGSNMTDPCSGGTKFVGISSALLDYLYFETNPGTYYWSVGANNGSGIPATYSIPSSFVVASSPYFSSMVIKNSLGNITSWDNTNYSHVCKRDFFAPSVERRVIFQMQLTDADGGIDITSATMQLKGKDYPMTLGNAVGTGRTATVTVDFTNPADNFDVSEPIFVTITDTTGSSGLLSTGKFFKVWDCNVNTSGYMYDSSAELTGAVCMTGHGFTVLDNGEMNFKTVSVGATTVDAFGNYYNLGNLTWGINYTPQINSDLLASGVVTRWIDMGVGTTSCGASQTLNSSVIDPYSSPVQLKVDFSGIKNQKAWFLTVGGGINASENIQNMVPVTCANDPGCIPAMSTESTAGAEDNGLISAKIIANDSGCGETCLFSYPANRNWANNRNILSSKESYAYQYFYDRYFSASGSGIALSGDKKMSDLGVGATGVYLVNGNFTVDVSNTVDVGKFLMIVTKGSITFNGDVDYAAGVFIADGGIVTSSALVDVPLIIRGMLYSPKSNIRLNRGMLDTQLNNSQPGVVVRYRPDFVFNMPGNLFKVLSGWKQL